MGFNARWGVMGAADVGAKHQRDRIWIVAYAPPDNWPTPTTPSGGGNCGGSGAYKNAIKNGTHIPHSINPNLYEWLMGWPIGWTDLKPLAMGKWPFVPQQHGES